ncbi:MAG: hypothetical protein KDE45_13710, partial [Caldilineaceae bacterium]|nr:hypothetical protein [Caldilineaceae bacterium]
MAHESRFPAWAWWIIGAITILAISILVFSVVLGIRAGQEQVEIQRRQQIGIALQRATDAQVEGNLQAALDEYQKILVLDPSNDLAQQGIKNLLALASGGEAAATQPATGSEPAASPLSAPTATATAVAPVTAAPTSTPASTLIGYWDDAQRAVKAGRWQEALNNLILVQQIDPSYRVSEVNDELFTAYVNLALEKDNADNLEEALTLYQKALALRPGATDIQRDRDLLEQYLQVLTYTGVDWELTTAELTALFNLEPDYRDVAERLHAAGRAYHCYCTTEELEDRNAKARAEGRAPGYDGHCRELTDEQVAAYQAEGRQPVLRFRMPDRAITFTDVVRGDITFQPENVPDYALVRANGHPLYTLVNPVDDAMMEITHVLR